jgi:hypothetical protein
MKESESEFLCADCTAMIKRAVTDKPKYFYGILLQHLFKVMTNNVRK